mmetsp:Transcript_4840/g.9041  ORF Transcript_4840/g.9041 Transcript_4840/m.9041 type:complete len:330 (+) Transcript_4840:735-1724(+)
MEELDCPLCLRVFYEPVTSSCGHSYCKNCLLECFKRGRKCPICRKPASISNSVPVTIVLQKLVERLRKEDFDSRIEEETTKRTELLAQLESSNQFLPVLLMHEILYLPGILAELKIFEPRYLRMVQEALNTTKLFGVYSSFKGSHLGVTLEVTSWDDLPDGTIGLTALVKKRFVADGITSDLVNLIPNQEISSTHYTSDELYYCSPAFVTDEPETEDFRPQEHELSDFMDRCLSTMHPLEKTKLLRSFHSQIDKTFFALSILDIDYDSVISMFKCAVYSQRLEGCLAFIRSGAASRSRMRIKGSKWMMDSTKATVLLVVVALLFFLLAK